MDPVLEVIAQGGVVGLVVAGVVLTARSVQPVAIAWLDARRARAASDAGLAPQLLADTQAQRADWIVRLERAEADASNALREATEFRLAEEECLRRFDEIEERLDIHVSATTPTSRRVDLASRRR